MNLFDPNRAQLAQGIPRLQVSGLPTAVPPIHLIIQGPWAVRVMIWLPVGSNRYRDYNLVIPLGEIESLLELWQDDPEGTAREKFGWTGTSEDKSLVTQRVELNAEELGL